MNVVSLEGQDRKDLLLQIIEQESPEFYAFIDRLRQHKLSRRPRPKELTRLVTTTWFPRKSLEEITKEVGFRISEEDACDSELKLNQGLVCFPSEENKPEDNKRKKFTVYIHRQTHPVRQQFIYGHELGHILLFALYFATKSMTRI